MSNRRKTTRERMMQTYRNGGGVKSLGTIVQRKPGGDLARTEGARNYPYGPRPGARRSLASIHRDAARPRREYGGTPDYEAMTRDGLRALAKEKGLSGYGRMNKAELIEAVSA